jgi:hypothetical protein
MESFGFGSKASNSFGFSGFGSASAESAGSASDGLNWTYFLIGAALAAFIAILIYFVVEKADTRPVIDGFKDEVAAPVQSTLYSAYEGHVSPKSDALLELQQLDAKLAAFKRDLTSPDKTIDASKLVDYNTYQDIRPLADWTSQCFSKNVPERDITLQMERWFLSGKRTLADLNAAAGFAAEKNVDRLEAAIEDVKAVALKECVAVAHKDIQGLQGAHDPESWGSAETETSALFD